MDDDTRKIMTMIAAFDAEHARLHEAVQSLHGSADRLALMIRQAAQSAVEDALKGLHPQIERAGQTLQGLQRFSLWRTSLQHLAVAVVAMVIALLGVWWYVPSQGDIAARRAERDELQASIDDLTKRGAKMKTIGCGGAAPFRWTRGCLRSNLSSSSILSILQRSAVCRRQAAEALGLLS